jgi:hypothetical protein
LQGPATTDVFPAVSIREAMAIWTEHPEILDPMVILNSIDVVDMA